MLQPQLKATEQALISFDRNNPVDCQKLDVISEIIDSQIDERLPRKPKSVSPEVWQFCINVWKKAK